MSADDIKARQAFDAYDEGDFETAFEMWHELAQEGDAFAQNNLSALYDAGEGVPQDANRAYRWALEAAKNGHQASLGSIGRKLILGSGVTTDVEKGIECLQSAADAGDARSMTMLGSFYLLGKHRPKSLEVGAGLLQKAAEACDPLAQLILANCYDHGMGVPVDRSLSTHWYIRAAEAGSVPAMYPVGARLIDGDCLPLNVPKGLQFLKEAAAGGIARAMRKLGDVYWAGTVVDMDVIEAFNWYEKAAELGDVDSQFLLGLRYTQGSDRVSIQLNPIRGVYWLEKAVVQGDAEAMAFLAKVLFNGEGVPPDKSRGLEVLRLGVAAGEPLCQFFLGRLHLVGNYVNLDLKQGLDLITQSANQNFGLARSCLCGLRIRGLDGLLRAEPEAAIAELEHNIDELDRDAALTAGMYYYPDPVHRDDAVFWLQKAAESGLEAAYFYLGVLLVGFNEREQIRLGVDWLKRASPSPEGRAEFNLAEIYRRGEKLEPDLEQAWQWAKLSSELGCDFGTLNLVQLQITPESGHYDPQDALKLANRLAEKGLHNAMLLLGYIYENGIGVPPNINLAITWYVRAAEAGSDESARILGIKYFDGDGVPESRAQAVKWLTSSAENGDVRSMLYLMLAHGEDKEIPEDMVLAYTYLALARPYATGQQRELIELLEPDFKSQISPQEVGIAEAQADEIRARESFSPS